MLALDLVEQLCGTLVIGLVHRPLRRGVKRIDVARDVGGIPLGAIGCASGEGKGGGTRGKQQGVTDKLEHENLLAWAPGQAKLGWTSKAWPRLNGLPNLKAKRHHAACGCGSSLSSWRRKLSGFTPSHTSIGAEM